MHILPLREPISAPDAYPLKWDQVDLEANELRLPDTKTGPRTISLSPEAAAVLSAIPHVDGNPFVIPGKIKGKAMRNLNDP